jgi:spore coat polysaccharide biosynthesis protein SpsF (cytidylyltransferase family)
MIDGKRVVATIEGRMTSTRLPGKIMMPLAGKPVMAHMIERHRRSTYTDEVVVATTTNAADDSVAKLAQEMGAPCFRGSEDDVLGRVVGAGKEHRADILVQGMADSPLVDWRIIDHLLEMHVEGGYDCTSNEFEETFPVGFDARVYEFSLLAEAEKNDTSEAFREHAGYSIRSQPDKFKLGNWKAEGIMLWPTLRLTLDTPEDYALIGAVYDELYPKNPDFSAEDVVAFLKTRPDLVALNAEVKQKVPTL